MKKGVFPEVEFEDMPPHLRDLVAAMHGDVDGLRQALADQPNRGCGDGHSCTKGTMLMVATGTVEKVVLVVHTPVCLDLNFIMCIKLVTHGVFEENRPPRFKSRLGIIPQDPTMFERTVRGNLDPLNEYPDTEIWEVDDNNSIQNIQNMFHGFIGCLTSNQTQQSFGSLEAAT
ncbi:hypothetical protein M8C21_031692, partial [Ambrosia artemisiifolia]